MEALKLINFIISILFFACYVYQILYIPIPLLWKEKQHKKTRLHRYAVLIAARNEESVITHLIDSIKNQTYPAELITVFVVADNCSDNTASLAREHGAIVYERFNTQQIGKGYAMDYLTQRIARDYGKNRFDGYFVFDADNLLKEDYIEEMNKTFSDGYQIVTSYRNSKNYGDNWISAGYAQWFLRESKYLNNARMLLGTSCAVSGTGFLFSREILKKNRGWKFYLLTEDIEFTVNSVINGEKIGYCKTAVIYDEQPTTFKQSWNQRLRWARGYLQVFYRYGKDLIKGIFKGNFSCFDMSMSIMPAIVLTMFSVLINTTASVIGAVVGDDIMIAVNSILETIRNAYLMIFALGLITLITEWKNIHTSVYKKILYTFTFPLFMFTYVPISLTALFAKTSWKPIKHSRSLSLREVLGG
ncbi:MAG: glycosyltransferase family 2 protein [Papillibacter sp.]|nr:glycosyltransferase family 2 protein [Papillibacter sp.]